MSASEFAIRPDARDYHLPGSNLLGDGRAGERMCWKRS